MCQSDAHLRISFRFYLIQWVDHGSPQLQTVTICYGFIPFKPESLFQLTLSSSLKSATDKIPYSSPHSTDGKELSAWTGSYPRIGFPSGMKHVVFTYFHGFTKIRFYFVFCFVRPLIENKNPLVQRILGYASDGRLFRFNLVVRGPFYKLRDRFLLQAQGPDASTSSASAPPQ